jgi:hypothetical protein
MKTILAAPLLVLTTLFLHSVYLFPTNAFAAVPGDFDGDGNADFSVGISYRNRNNTGSSAWATRIGTDKTNLFWTWPVPADAYVSGRFFASDPKYYPGIVWVRDARKPLEWYLKNGTNQSTFVSFGLPGDIVPNLADWDGDGLEDLTVVRPISGGALTWYVKLSSTGQILFNVFGIKGDKVGAYDVDGDGLAEMIALRDGYNWFIRRPAELSFTQVQWGLNGDIPLLPRDLDGDHLVDYVIARRSAQGQVAYVRYGNGKTNTFALGPNNSIPQISKIGSANLFSWWQRDTGKITVRNADETTSQFQFGIPTNALIRDDGTVVQPAEDASFGKSTTSVVPPSDSNSSNGSATCARTLNSGWLFKPESQDSGGSRQGKPLVLFSRNFPSTSCLNVIATNGAVIGHYGRYSANRFYSGWGCGEGLTAPTLAQKALSATGSKNILLQDPTSNSCFGPAPADARTDRR